MTAPRKLKRIQAKRIKPLLTGISTDARGNVDVWLPSRRKAISLSAKEAAITRALLASLDRPSTLPLPLIRRKPWPKNALKT